MPHMLEHFVAAVADGVRKLNEYGHDIPETAITERSRNIVNGLIGADDEGTRLLGDRERCIYWLLRIESAFRGHGPEPLFEGLADCLKDMDYHPDSDRAARMLDLGEAGRYLPPADRGTS